MSDVQKTPTTPDTRFDSSFRQSRWFTRGWTLQELIAPSWVLFFDSDWRLLGDRQGLSQAIRLATSLPYDILLGQRAVNDFSIAARMAWASRRSTTRIEDEAYCLLGLFDVNMPLLYGEGTKAFTRLQEEIGRSSDDHSIFAWRGIRRSLLASSPADFYMAWTIARVEDVSQPPYELTKRGLWISLRVGEDYNEVEGYYDVAILDCVDLVNPSHSIALPLERRGETENGIELVSLPDRRALRSIDGARESWPHFATRKRLLFVDKPTVKERMAPIPVQLCLARHLRGSALSTSLHPVHEWQQDVTYVSSGWSEAGRQVRVIDLMYTDGLLCMHFLVVFGSRSEDDVLGPCDIFLVTSTCGDDCHQEELSMAMSLYEPWLERNKESLVEQDVYVPGKSELAIESCSVFLDVMSDSRDMDAPQNMQDGKHSWPSKASIRETTVGAQGRAWAVIIE